MVVSNKKTTRRKIQAEVCNIQLIEGARFNGKEKKIPVIKPGNLGPRKNSKKR
jgi:hypothetical protein